jgi:hypothetical protein
VLCGVTSPALVTICAVYKEIEQRSMHLQLKFSARFEFTVHVGKLLKLDMMLSWIVKTNQLEPSKLISDNTILETFLIPLVKEGMMPRKYFKDFA